MVNSILKLDNLEKALPYQGLTQKRFKLKAHIDFPKAQVSALLGHNGAGKTTLIRMILGMIRADSGSIFFEGESLTTAHRRSFGYMPETNKLPLELTPAEVLKLQLTLCLPKNTSSSHKKMVAHTLEKIGLIEEQNKKIKILSKGMARRLAWGVASIHEPKLLILDEPFSGLDPLERQNMLKWFQDGQNSQQTIIISTHEVFFIKQIIDYTAILQNGNVVYSSHEQIGDDKILQYFKRGTHSEPNS